MKERDLIEDKIERLNKIASALEDIYIETPINAKASYKVLEQYSISSEVDPKDTKKVI